MRDVGLTQGDGAPTRLEQQVSLDETLLLLNRVVHAAVTSIVVTDPHLPDNPIVYHNPAFERISGYTGAEIDGYNCRFLQGPDTDRDVVAEIKSANADERPCHVILRNYRKDGTAFWNELHISPVHDENGRLTHFVGVQTDVTRRAEAEKERDVLLAQQKRIAETLQRALLLTPAASTLDGLDISTQYEAAWDEAQFGGDFFDTVSLSETLVALVVGDCTGKGLSAAQYTAEVKYALRVLLREYRHPTPALHRLNAFLMDAQRLDARDQNALVCVTVVIIDKDTGEGIVASAGMEPLLIVRSDGTAEAIETQGQILGMDITAEYTAKPLAMGDGDTLIVVTDGITEARGPRPARAFFGFDGLVQTAVRAATKFATPASIGESIVRAAKGFADGRPQDDVCVLIARRSAAASAAVTVPVASSDELSPEFSPKSTVSSEIASDQDTDLAHFALEITGLGYWELDTSTGITRRSAHHDTIFGYGLDGGPPRPSEWSYRDFLTHVYPDDRATVDALYGRALALGTEWKFECRITRANDAQIRWIQAHGRHFRRDDSDSDLGSTRIIGTVADITERRNAEAAQQAASAELQRKDRDLEMILTAVTDPIISWDKDWRFTYVNAGGAHVLGRPAAELIGKGVLDIFPDLEGTTFYDAYRTAMRENRAVEITDFFPPFDNWFEVRAYPSSAGLTLYLRDIAERRQREAVLREVEERRRLATESANVGTWDYDLQRDELRWDDKCREFFGVPASAEITYATFLSGLHSDDRERMDAAVRRVLDPTGDGELNEEYRTVSVLDGRQRWIETRGRAVFDDKKQRPLRLIGTVLDITDRKLAEERDRFLNALSEQMRSLLDPDIVLYEAARMVGEFTGVSRALFGEVQEAPGGDPDAATISVHHDFVRAGVPSIAGMTRPLLSFGREIIDDLRAGKVTASEDILNDSRIRLEYRAAFAELGIRAFVGAPVHKGGQWVSLLVLHHDSPRQWPTAERELLAAVAERTHLAVDNARLYREQARVTERLQLAVEAAGLGAWEIDLTKSVPESSLDTRTLALFGRAAGSFSRNLKGLAWYEWIHPEDRDRVLAEFTAAMESTVTEYHMEYRVLWPDGETIRWVSALARVLRETGEAQRPLRVIGVCRDITPEREATTLQRRFLREMLFGLTEGRLRLCESAADLPREATLLDEALELRSETLWFLRKRIETAAAELDFPKERVQDLLTAAGEASMNAIRHATGGTAEIHADIAGKAIQVWVRDQGDGIAEHLIHRAVEVGWTTGGFGAGFYLMRQTCDRVYLHTTSTGTTVVLEMNRTLPMPIWLAEP
ncbi:MAG: PAS domain S-box protein [Armatimonadota bacterium]